MDFGQIITRPCENVVPPPDPRCADPAFAAANPGICPAATGLIIKPGVALACVLGSIQFRAFTVLNGVETDVTGQASFSSSDLSIVVIGVTSGNATATGLQAGQATISATFQGLMAHTVMTVLAVPGDSCCDSEQVALTVLVDTSRSMSQNFNGAYATKLAYAKAAATQFIGEINETKDLIGLDSFNSDQVLTLSVPISDKAAVAAQVPPIVQTQSDTAFFSALQQAINELNATSANLKVLLLISDGLATADEADNPYGLLTDFKSSGGVVMCLGVRAAPVGFAALAAFATPGFFVNAYNATAADALQFISGLKGYICAGNCTPAGDVIVNKGQLDYHDFINWDVVNGDSAFFGGFAEFQDPDTFYTFTTGTPHGFTSGDVVTIRGAQNFPIFNGTFTITVTTPTKFTCPIPNQGSAFGEAGLSAWINVAGGSVDLLGNGFFDLLPGNGLYVDLISGLNATPPFNGELVTKTTLAVHPDHQYQIVVKLAGNQVVSRATDTVALQVYWLNGSTKTYLINQQINISDYKQGFTTYSFVFSVVADLPVWISIQQLDLPTEAATLGVLLGEVTFNDLTDLVQMFDDNFDAENPVYVPPRCGQGTTYMYVPDMGHFGYEYGYNCYGVGCLDTPPPVQQPDPNPLTDIESGDAPPVVTYTSTQTVCTACGSGSANFAGCSDYAQADCATVAHSNTTFASGVFVFAYELFASQAAVAYQLTRQPSSGTGPPTDWDFQGSDDGTTWTTIDSQTGQTFASGETKKFDISNTTPYLHYRISSTNGAPQETLFQIYLLAPEQACGTATAESTISQAQADANAKAAALLIAQAKLNCQALFSFTATAKASCTPGLFGPDVFATETRTSSISLQDAVDKANQAAHDAAQLMLVCTGSNNTQTIFILDRGSLPGPAPSEPFPSVKFVSGMTGLVTKVTVSLFGFAHNWPSDVVMVLKSPDGTTCAVMAHVGDGGFAVVTPIDLIFDDAAGSMLPASGLITAGTWKPSQFGSFADVPIPGPVSPYGTTLSVFNGINPNGAWSLWVCDEQSGNDGQILGGFDLTITTA